MKIVFRTDASVTIGSGHVMRCLTLADELRKRGADISFISREHPANLNDLLESKGYHVLRLDKPVQKFAARSDDLAHAAWLGVPWEQDAADTAAALGEGQPDWLIVDHYAIDYRWEERLRSRVAKIMVIDDLADRPHNCDLLLDQNLYRGMETRYDGLVPRTCQKLLGPRHALLRPEFAEARKGLLHRDGLVTRVLVFFGGMDPTNETEKALHALMGITDREFVVDVIVGGGNLRKAQIQAICEAHEGFSFHCQIDNMAELMSAADLAIGAGGTATWERCALGLPALVVAVAENQFELATCGAEAGLFFYLGTADSVDSSRMQDVLRTFCSSPAALRCMSAQALAMVDARGAQRVGGMFVPPRITVRPAQEEDCDFLYDWRNAEETRRYIFDSASIPLETHRAWFRKSLLNPARILLIGEIDGRPVGVLRYDCAGEEALISVYLVPGGKGQGVGTELIRCGSRWVREHRPEIKRINAEIMRENVASLRAFEQAGYNEHHVTFQEVLEQ